MLAMSDNSAHGCVHSLFIRISFQAKYKSEREFLAGPCKSKSVQNLCEAFLDTITIKFFEFKRIIWFHFFLLPYAHCGLSYVSLIAVQSFGAVAPIEKAGEAIKVLMFHT